MIKVNCKGMSCPLPVMEARRAISLHPDSLIEIVVDNDASRENVQRFLNSQGWEVTVESGNGMHVIVGAPPKCELVFEPVEKETAHQGVTGGMGTVFLITTDMFGQGSEELGRKLMVNFVMTLNEIKDSIWRIILVNGGVRLTCEDSSVCTYLRDIEDAGVSVLVCGTCLEFFGLIEMRQVGEVTNMLDIVTSMELASKVIHI